MRFRAWVLVPRQGTAARCADAGAAAGFRCQGCGAGAATLYGFRLRSSSQALL